MELTAQDRLAALRANAKAKGIVAQQPTNPAVIGQRVIAKFYKECNGWVNHGCGLKGYVATIHGTVTKIDGMQIWVTDSNTSYKVNALGCHYIK